MRRLLPLALCLGLVACVEEPELPVGDVGPVLGHTSPPDAGVDAGAVADAGAIDAGGQRVACDPQVLPLTCPMDSYCACLPTDGGCFCFAGDLGDPCPTGSALCQAPGICRWSSGSFWGKCGNVPGVAGDVCDRGGFFCDPQLVCDSCDWGLCCQ
jgi:hypothetical protein